MGFISSTVKGQAFVLLPPAISPEVALSPPEIDSLSSSTGAAGDVITFTGLNFAEVTAVDFNGTPAASITNLSDTQMQITVPAGFDDGPVHATNDAGTGTGPSFFSTEDLPMLGPVQVQTTDAAPAALVLAAPGAQGVYRYEMRLVGQTSDGAHTRSWLLTATVKRDGGAVVTLVGDNANNLDDAPPDGEDAVAEVFTSSFSVQANVPELDVQDPNGNTVNWSVKYTMTKVL